MKTTKNQSKITQNRLRNGVKISSQEAKLVEKQGAFDEEGYAITRGIEDNSGWDEIEESFYTRQKAMNIKDKPFDVFSWLSYNFVAPKRKK